VARQLGLTPKHLRAAITKGVLPPPDVALGDKTAAAKYSEQWLAEAHRVAETQAFHRAGIRPTEPWPEPGKPPKPRTV
jgi:hypothetical protein